VKSKEEKLAECREGEGRREKDRDYCRGLAEEMRLIDQCRIRDELSPEAREVCIAGWFLFAKIINRSRISQIIKCVLFWIDTVKDMNEILCRADTIIKNDEPEIRTINQVILAAKVQAIREAQLAEKVMIR